MYKIFVVDVIKTCIEVCFTVKRKLDQAQPFPVMTHVYGSAAKIVIIFNTWRKRI